MSPARISSTASDRLDTNINMMVLPGQVSNLKTTFDKPGTYNVICHEYCGIGHHTMYGQIVVEEVAAAAAANE